MSGACGRSPARPTTRPISIAPFPVYRMQRGAQPRYTKTAVEIYGHQKTICFNGLRFEVVGQNRFIRRGCGSLRRLLSRNVAFCRIMPHKNFSFFGPCGLPMARPPALPTGPGFSSIKYPASAVRPINSHSSIANSYASRIRLNSFA